MSDRAEREKQLDWLYRLKSNLKIFIPKDFHLAEFEQSLDYAISSIKTDLKYDLLYEETKHIANVSKMIEPTTNNTCAEQNGCITCSLDDGDDCCRKLYEESMQEPTTKNDLGVDAISRQAVLDLINADWKYENLEIEINNLPSVTPQEPRWIPVSEKLPEPFTFVNATCRSLVDDRENWVVETLYLPIPKEVNKHGYSDWGNIPMLNWGDAEVIAWVERIIPQPYKAEVEPQESEG